MRKKSIIDISQVYNTWDHGEHIIVKLKDVSPIMFLIIGSAKMFIIIGVIVFILFLILVLNIPLILAIIFKNYWLLLTYIFSIVFIVAIITLTLKLDELMNSHNKTS